MYALPILVASAAIVVVVGLSILLVRQRNQNRLLKIQLQLAATEETAQAVERERQDATEALEAQRVRLEIKHQGELAVAQLDLKEHKEGEAQRIKEKINELRDRADEAYKAKQWRQAASWTEQYLAIAQVSGNTRLEAAAYGTLAHIYRKQGDLDLAAIMFKRAYELAKTVLPAGDKQLESFQGYWVETEHRITVRKIVGIIQRADAIKASNPEAAQKLYEDAADMAEKEELPNLQFNALYNSTGAYLRLDQEDKALAVLGKAMQIVETTMPEDSDMRERVREKIVAAETSKLGRRARKIMDEAVADFRSENYYDAVMRARDAVEAAEQAMGPAHWLVAQTLSVLGLSLFNNEEIDEATQVFNRAYRIISQWNQSERRLYDLITHYRDVCRRLG